MSTNKLRNMTAEESIELLTEIKNIFQDRVYFSYNTSLINPFQEQISLINSILSKYTPTDDTNILDIHGMSIINSILKVNAISNRFTDKYFNNATRYSNEPEYLAMVNNADSNFISFVNSKGYDGSVELTRVKKLIDDFSNGPVRIRPVNISITGSEENITEAFDYHLLVYLTICLKIENDIYKKKYQQFIDAKRSNAGSKLFHTSKFNDVSSCRSSCVGLCSASCDTTCYGCGGSCAGQCTQSCADCSKSCTMTCSNGCSGGCSGCNGCSSGCNGCTNSCTGTCGNTGAGGCEKCDGSCYGSTSGATLTCGCGSTCNTECGISCTSQAAQPTLHTGRPGPEFIGEVNFPPETDDEPDPPNPMVIPGLLTPDRVDIPSPEPPRPTPPTPSYRGPSGGYHSNGDGTGYWTYDYGGETYRSDTNTDTNHSGGGNSSGDHNTPWGSNSSEEYHKA